jgi:hypothetical protein
MMNLMQFNSADRPPLCFVLFCFVLFPACRCSQFVQVLGIPRGDKGQRVWSTMQLRRKLVNNLLRRYMRYLLGLLLWKVLFGHCL